MMRAWRQVGLALVDALRETFGQVELKEQLVELREEVAALYEQSKPAEPSMQIDALADKLDSLDQRLARMEEGPASSKQSATPSTPEDAVIEEPAPTKATGRKREGKTHTDLVVEAIGALGGSATTGQLVAHLSLKGVQVRNALAKLRYSGVIKGTPVDDSGRSNTPKVWTVVCDPGPVTLKAESTPSPKPSKVIPMPPRPRRENELEEAVLEHLRNSPAGVSIEAISKAVDIRPKKVGEIVEALVDEGLVESDRRGVRLSRMSDEDWKLLKVLRTDGRALPAMEIAQRTHLPLARAIERLEALEEDGRVLKAGEKWRLGVVS